MNTSCLWIGDLIGMSGYSQRRYIAGSSRFRRHKTPDAEHLFGCSRGQSSCKPLLHLPWSPRSALYRSLDLPLPHLRPIMRPHHFAAANASLSLHCAIKLSFGHCWALDDKCPKARMANIGNRKLTKVALQPMAANNSEAIARHHGSNSYSTSDNTRAKPIRSGTREQSSMTTVLGHATPGRQNTIGTIEDPGHLLIVQERANGSLYR